MGKHLDALKAKTAALKNTSSGEVLTDFLAALDQLWRLDTENRALVRAAVDEFLGPRRPAMPPRFLATMAADQQKRDAAGEP
jgi:hypothetical protein